MDSSKSVINMIMFIILNKIKTHNYPHALKKTKGDIVIASVRVSVSPLCYLLNHWTNWCVSYSHKWGVQRYFFGPPPGALERGQISFDFIYKVNFKMFIPNFVSILTNEKYKTYKTGFSFCRLGHALWWDLGVLRCQKLNSVRPTVRYAISS